MFDYCEDDSGNKEAEDVKNMEVKPFFCTVFLGIRHDGTGQQTAMQCYH